MRPFSIIGCKLTFTPGKSESCQIKDTSSKPPADIASPFKPYWTRLLANVTRPEPHISTPSGTVNGQSPGQVASDTKPAGALLTVPLLVTGASDTAGGVNVTAGRVVNRAELDDTDSTASAGSPPPHADTSKPADTIDTASATLIRKGYQAVCCTATQVIQTDERSVKALAGQSNTQPHLNLDRGGKWSVRIPRHTTGRLLLRKPRPVQNKIRLGGGRESRHAQPCAPGSSGCREYGSSSLCM